MVSNVWCVERMVCRTNDVERMVCRMVCRTYGVSTYGVSKVWCVERMVCRT